MCSAPPWSGLAGCRAGVCSSRVYWGGSCCPPEKCLPECPWGALGVSRPLLPCLLRPCLGWHCPPSVSSLHERALGIPAFPRECPTGVWSWSTHFLLGSRAAARRQRHLLPPAAPGQPRAGHMGSGGRCPFPLSGAADPLHSLHHRDPKALSCLAPFHILMRVCGWLGPGGVSWGPPLPSAAAWPSAQTP